jgi:hydrogenase-4 component F
MSIKRREAVLLGILLMAALGLLVIVNQGVILAISPALIALLVIPIALLVCCVLIDKQSVLRNVVPIGLWIQLVLIAYLFKPLLANSSSRLILWGEDLVVDRLAACFVMLTTLVVACALTHAQVYFAAEENDPAHGVHKARNEKYFYFASIAFVIAMCAVFLCNNLGLIWMGIEATTLCSAPLVYFDRTKNALEATWKYLIVCSVGIAFALLGTVLIFAASQHGAWGKGSLNLYELINHAEQLNYPLLRLGFIFVFLGFGTKAGVFPLHSWLPDAHSEAPAPASAMLSGALLNCALYGIWRVFQIMSASGHQVFAARLCLAMGALTVVAAALFLIRQHGFKRMWAYSSIENVGIMLVAIGLGSQALFFMQALNHSLCKVALFLISGNIVQACHAKRLHKLHGIMTSSPLWGCLLTLCTFAVMGMPPFGTFISEMLILSTSATLGRWACCMALLFALGIAFVAVATHVGRILFGGPKPNFSAHQPIVASLVPGLLITLSLLLGITISPPIWTSLK